MPRGSIDQGDGRVLRCALVWLVATSAMLAVWWLTAPACASLTTPSGWHGTFDTLLVRVCAAALLPSTGWLWVVTTATVAGVVRGRTRGEGAVRRLVLLACGVALAAGAATPAGATGSGGVDSPDAVLAGLSLPDRAVAQPPPRASATPAAAGEHVVVPGDSLWAIAASQRATEPVDQRWRAIWAANREVIGDDPDLILPGQRLSLPTTTDDDRSTR